MMNANDISEARKRAEAALVLGDRFRIEDSKSAQIAQTHQMFTSVPQLAKDLLQALQEIERLRMTNKTLSDYDALSGNRDGS